MDKALTHYGILGMHWGKHKAAPTKVEPSRVVVKKGMTVAHVTEDGNFRLKDGALYIYHDPHDRNNYIGNFSIGRLGATEMLLKTKVDLVTPNQKKRVDAFVDTFKGTYANAMLTEMGKNKIQSSLFYGIIRLMNGSSFHDEALAKNPIGTIGFEKTAAERNAKKYKKLLESGRRPELEKVYQDFNAFLLVSNSNREKYFNTLRKQGYNAVMDQNDIKNYESRSPVIVFDAKKSLSISGSLKITDKMADDAFKQHMKDQNKVVKLQKQDAAVGWSAM